MSTAFWALSPGPTRLMVFSMIFTVGVEGRTLIEFIVSGTLPIAVAILVVMIRLRQAHPALVVALAGNLVALLVAWLGNNETWRAIADLVFL